MPRKTGHPEKKHGFSTSHWPARRVFDQKSVPFHGTRSRLDSTYRDGHVQRTSCSYGKPENRQPRSDIIAECKMKPSTIIKFRQQLEHLKRFEHLNAPSRFSYFGYLGELFLGAIILAQLLLGKGMEKFTITGIPHFVEWILFIIALVLIFHALYLIFRYHSDKRMRKVLEKILPDTSKESES